MNPAAKEEALAGWDDLDEKSRKRFEERGRNPRAWGEVARDLHRAAGLLWNRIESGTTDGEKADWFMSVGKIALMLEGLAVEMFAKAIRVSRDPGLIRGGQWTGPKGHRLPGLLAAVGFELASPVERDLVARLAAFVSWAGRYPIPKDYRESKPRLKGENKLELAPGTYYSTGDQHYVERLIARLDQILRRTIG
jgi:hypothetical protein